MQLIKSLRSFGRWLFNIKDEVKPNPYDVFVSRYDDSFKVYVLRVDDEFVYFRHQGKLNECTRTLYQFNNYYRKIS